ncbi:hypothetical protein C9374_008712 [Naegleria lovaniensis]|uniref:Dynein heavy chain coiled coil stalk domain-containing protein n=1 Tax=Naegleria lovaniensis TaxID=51637 RepID=A0AA88GJ94_NAELO|nr:uncharacterized protein C9374_008712 [Naegleria lovaniensis]KAG2378090.1 hypothetical protein C9374_008712 [Naegleria lovaniensis]
MASSQYLKDTIAPILARGIAECIEVQPQDPIEYLGLWMLHHQQQQALREKRLKQEEENQRAMDDWMETKGKLLQKAVERIQSVVRDFIRRQRAYKAEEQQKVMQLEKLWGELMVKTQQDQKTKEAESKEHEDALNEKERIMHEKMFEASKEFITKLEKDRITYIKKAFRPPPCVPRIMKAVLLALGVAPKDVKDWNMTKEKIGAPTSFIRKLVAFEPEASVGKTARFKRVSNILKKWDIEIVKQQSTVAFLLHQWLTNLLAFRESFISLKKAKKEEIEEEDDPGIMDDMEEDEKDDPTNIQASSSEEPKPETNDEHSEGDEE